ncbi:MAG TPA: alpha/beta fold hydrolase [Ilumatobacteraceae bacterium]
MRFARTCLAVGVVLASGCSSSEHLAGPSPTSTPTSPTSLTSSPADGSTPATGSNAGATQATTSTTGAGETTATISPIAWSRCNDPEATDDTLKCATVTVPLDYSKPNGTTVDLALVMYPATDARHGAVLFNPGGPGGSGFDYIADGGSAVSDGLGLSNYDLIGFDPRGVDRSGGLRCLTDAQLDKYAYLDDTPDTPAEQQLLDESDTILATSCKAKYGDTLQYYSTDNTARDMDSIRRALGDDTISYLGVSYGTYLGAVYATLFPTHVRAMVLDSAFQPSGDTVEQQYTTQLVGFEHAFDDWASWCQTDSTCAFHSADVGAAWDGLRQQLDDHPIANADGRSGNQAVLEQATIAALYSKDDWPVLASAAEDATKGDPAALFRLADSYSERDDNGHYNTIEESDTIITCASGFEPQTPPDPAALAAKLKSLAPRFAENITAKDLAMGDDCDAMMPEQPIDKLAYSGKAPVVVIGGENDPATPIRWAQEMVKAMGASSTLVTYTGEGHGQLLVSTCVTDIEGTLLTDLTLPAAGTVCDPDPDIAKPSWWDTVPVPAGVDGVLDSPELAGALGISPTQIYSELRTSSLDMAAVIAAYKAALAPAGFTFEADRTPLTGSTQSVYTAANGDILSVFVLSADAFTDPTLASVAQLLPSGKTLVLVLYIPQS